MADDWPAEEGTAEACDPGVDIAPPKALWELTEALRLSEQHESVFTVASLLGRLAALHARWGNGERAVGLGRQALGLARDAELYCAPLLADLALAESVGGVWARALDLAERGVREAEAVGDGAYAAVNQHLVGMVRLFEGDAAGSLPALLRARDAFAEADPAAVLWSADLVEALVVTGDLDEAEAMLTACRVPARRLARSSVLAALDRCAGLLLAERGRVDAAVEVLEGVVARQRVLPQAVELVRTLVALSQVERARRRRAAARARLVEAERLCARSGALAWLWRVRGEVERLAGGGRENAELTPVEQRTASLVLTGATNREIASELSISVKTVEATLGRVYRKTGVRSRVELVRRLSAPVKVGA